jgi:hypothetical protein
MSIGDSQYMVLIEIRNLLRDIDQRLARLEPSPRRSATSLRERVGCPACERSGVCGCVNSGPTVIC